MHLPRKKLVFVFHLCYIIIISIKVNSIGAESWKNIIYFLIAYMLFTKSLTFSYADAFYRISFIILAVRVWELFFCQILNDRSIFQYVVYTLFFGTPECISVLSASELCVLH